MYIIKTNQSLSLIIVIKFYDFTRLHIVMYHKNSKMIFFVKVFLVNNIEKKFKWRYLIKFMYNMSF